MTSYNPDTMSQPPPDQSFGCFDDASEDVGYDHESSSPPPPPAPDISASSSLSIFPNPSRKPLPPSLSGAARGRRAPAPAALDLRPREGTDWQQHPVEPRRVSRPLPVPPRSTARTLGDVPLSAVGTGDRFQTTTDGPRTSSDHYDHQSTSVNHRSPQTGQPNTRFSPGSPEILDPAIIDRNNLIGVGELSTPRWATAEPIEATPPVPSRNWIAGQTGLGLGVGVHDEQHLLSLNTLANYDFHPAMTTELAASLSVPDDSTSSSLLSPPLASPHPSTTYPEVSPGTARSRIYARRMSRQAAMAVEPPSRSSSKQSPPHSADPYRNRRTPPQSTPKSKPSPSSSHHDILKHFAPKDFSHLPPSPSSASINQFLRGSGSNNNVTLVGTPPSVSNASYFAATPATFSVDAETAEALRKLDGLSSTPAKKPLRAKASASMTSIHSRPGTPPPGRRRLSASSHEKLDSPLNNWVDLADAIPAVPFTRPPSSKRESASTTSASRETSVSSAQSASGKDRSPRRVSAGSDIAHEVTGIPSSVPPVPPLPSNYSRQAVTLDSPEFSSPVSDTNRPRQMTKKWSFSSALNMRLQKDSSPVSPGLDVAKSPHLETMHPSSDEGSRSSTTPVGVSSQAVKSGPPKRLTPSSIPFFRRTSSQSIESMPPPSSTTRNVPSSTVRKSVLGVSIPSMLRTNSKRTISGQIEPEAVTATPQFSSTGWAGRKRGKTLSISDNPGKLSAPPTQLPRTSVPDATRSIPLSNGNAPSLPTTGLPSIKGSPALKQPPSTSSLRESPRNLPSVTPTKIPRMTRPAESPAMPQPPTSRNATLSSRNTSTSISEFGSISGLHNTSRQNAHGTHRAHLLAPMSARTEGRRPEKHTESRHQVFGQAVPPSRRNLPIPQSITAPTASSIAKRSSREFRGDPRVKSSNGQQTSSGSSSPVKPSKSLHTKLGAPPSRLPTSSSMGAASSRKSSLVPDSPSASPFEDDETRADAEMAAYVQRRRARHANGKKEDLSDVNGFPEDTQPSTPLSQREYISKQLSSLTDYERKEVLDYDLIYYFPPSRINRPSGGYNHGYDDERGDYHVVDGDHLCYRYQVEGMLGKGSFGQVVRCRDHKTGGSAAIKIIRNKKRFHTQALVEVRILQQLVEWDPEDRHYMVRMTDHFYFRGHLCIVTEMLSINLYELIKANQFAGFSTILIRRFTVQMLASLQLMRSHRIVHCDLKPENILLCHPCKSGIKVIDFGSSCLETEKVYTYIQSRFYRSPEVILGMNYAMAIDMWSLGCILAELYTGVPIFPGENEHEQLACIMEVLGVPDRYIVEKASRRKLFFDASGAPRPFVNAKGKRRRPGAKTLAAILTSDDELFLDFIAKCLTWDPDKRLKPQPALRHPWILAGRRRQAAPKASGLSANNSSKSALLISPPTPLVARSQQTIAASASRSTHGTRESSHMSSSSSGLGLRAG